MQYDATNEVYEAIETIETQELIELLIKNQETSEAIFYGLTTINSLLAFIVALLIVIILAQVWGHQ